ncbi:MAG: hypothetical protein GX806_01170, partial [Lentisphaerae bacterium]|nr:hypothetical protein [Lentisphaerota bacterium]
PLIVVMTASHMQELQRRFPAARDRAYLLSSFDPAGNNRDIADPIGFNMAIYRQTCAAIDAFLPDLILYLKEYEIRTQ